MIFLIFWAVCLPIFLFSTTEGSSAVESRRRTSPYHANIFEKIDDDLIYEITTFLAEPYDSLMLVDQYLHKSMSSTLKIRFFACPAFDMPEVANISKFEPEIQYIFSKYKRFTTTNALIFLYHDLISKGNFQKLQILIARFLGRVYESIDSAGVKSLSFKRNISEFLLDREEHGAFFEISKSDPHYHFVDFAKHPKAFEIIINNTQYTQKYIKYLESNSKRYELYSWISKCIEFKAPLEHYETFLHTFSDFEKFFIFLLHENPLKKRPDYSYYYSVLNYFLIKFPFELAEEYLLLNSVRFGVESASINIQCINVFMAKHKSNLVNAALLGGNVSLLQLLIDNDVELIDTQFAMVWHKGSEYSSILFDVFSEDIEARGRLLENYPFISSIMKNGSYSSFYRQGHFFYINFIPSPVSKSTAVIPIVLDLASQRWSGQLIDDFFQRVWSEIETNETIGILEFKNFLRTYLEMTVIVFNRGSSVVDLNEKIMGFLLESAELRQTILESPLSFKLNEKMTCLLFGNLGSAILLKDLIYFRIFDLIENLRTDQEIMNCEVVLENDIVSLLLSSPLSAPKHMQYWDRNQFFKLRSVFAYILKTPALRHRIKEFKGSYHVHSLLQLEFPEDMK